MILTSYFFLKFKVIILTSMLLLFFPFGDLREKKRKRKRKGKKKRTHIPKDKLQNHFRIQTCWGEP